MIGRNHGVTLIEMLVVIAVIVIIAGFSIGYLNSKKYRLKTFVQTLENDMAKAKLSAITNSKYVYVDFDFDNDNSTNNRYVIWMDSDGNKAFTAGDNVTVDRSKSYIVFSDLPTDQRFSFNALGRSKSDHVKIGITGEKMKYKITTNIMGRVKVEEE